MTSEQQAIESQLDPESLARLKRVRHIARLMDTAIKVPGTSMRFGLDSLIGLLPGAGDTATALVSAWTLWEADKLGVSHKQISKMGVNILIDLLIGSIPLLGDAFDFYWKANARNLKLLEDDLRKQNARSVNAPRRVARA